MLLRSFEIPTRLLAIGLPLCIAFGFALGLWILPALSLPEVALLATMLAPTDAALGKAMVTNPRMPPNLREGLKVEGGLNDGICVPVLFAFLALAVGEAPSGDSAIALTLGLFAQEIGIGAVLAIAACKLLGPLVRRGGWIGATWLPILVPALALLCFAAAQALHGSGLIAAFVGGITVALTRPQNKHEWLNAAEATGDTLSLLTWVVFGAAVVGQVVPRFGWDDVLYAVLSLTV